MIIRNEKKRFRIAVCDDDDRERMQIRNLCVEQLKTQIPCQYEILEMKNALEFLSYDEAIDLLILDIEMPGMTGLELKEQLQLAQKDCVILFVTDHEELSPYAFGIHVFGFVPKRNLNVQLPMALEGAVRLLCRCVVLEDGTESGKVVFIRAEDIYCSVFLENGSRILLRNSLDELEKELLPADFLRIRRECLVNPMYVERLTADEITVRSGKESRTFSVAVRKRKKVKEMYREFCKKQMRWC